MKRGIVTPKLLLIGEAPGEEEENSGIPFVGQSGACLQNQLESVGLQDSCYITNIVKCRPPDNRVPTKEEIKECVPWLIDQIALLEPKIIVFLGATSYIGLIGKKWKEKEDFKITKHQGQFFNALGYEAIVLFHPSYLLRNSDMVPGKPKYATWMNWIAIKHRLDAIMNSESL